MNRIIGIAFIAIGIISKNNLFICIGIVFSLMKE